MCCRLFCCMQTFVHEAWLPGALLINNIFLSVFSWTSCTSAVKRWIVPLTWNTLFNPKHMHIILLVQALFVKNSSSPSNPSMESGGSRDRLFAVVLQVWHSSVTSSLALSGVWLSHRPLESCSKSFCDWLQIFAHSRPACSDRLLLASKAVKVLGNL